MTTKPYSVTIWGSHPDNENDDCWSGDDFATNEEACAFYMQTCLTGKFEYTNGRAETDFAFVELSGPDIYLVGPNVKYDAKRAARKAAADDAEWRNEITTQAGMAFGTDGYNDAMGY